MFDKNYLGHKFKNMMLKGYYICNKCKIIIYWNESVYVRGQYWNLTCEEMIIKNIIE